MVAGKVLESVLAKVVRKVLLVKSREMNVNNKYF
jgi:hypothetical protein